MSTLCAGNLISPQDVIHIKMWLC